MSEGSTQRGWIAWMARHPVAANLLMVILLAGGFVVALNIKQEVFPEYELGLVQITIPYPGATPLDVERGVLEAIEEEVRGLDGVKEVRSVASEGMGTVLVELLLGTDNNQALQDIRNAVDRITSFPEEIERITVSLLTNRRKVIDLVLYGEQGEHVLRQLAETARDELTQRGITLVQLAGVRPLEVRVEVPQAMLRKYGLTLEAIARTIRATAREIPGGGVKTRGGEILIRTAERRDLAKEFADIPLVRAPDGTAVRLGDIAILADSFEDTDQSVYYDGQRAVLVQVYRVGDQTPTAVARIVKTYVAELQARLPEGVGVATQDDFSEIYRDRVRLLLRNAMLGLVLVLVILGVFLDLRLAFWVTMGIPISFLGAILLLPALGLSINMISLFAFIMALGMVVDDAIVVGENIYEMRRQGASFLEAAIRGAQQIFVPVVFSVLTNMVAFAPLLFVPGYMGKLFRTIPGIIIPVFIISLVESLLVLPHHLSRRRAGNEHGILTTLGRQERRVSDALARAIHRLYGPVVRLTLRWRYLTVAVGLAILLLTIGFIAGGRIDLVFMPHIESDWATAAVSLPYGAPVEETKKVVDRLIRGAYEVLDHDVKAQGGRKLLRSIQSTIGMRFTGHGPRRRAPGATGGHTAFVRVNFQPDRPRRFSTVAFANAWRRRVGALPNVDTLTFTAQFGPGGQAAIDVELSHRDVPVLEAAAKELAGLLAQFRGVKDIDSGVARGKPQRNITRTPEAIAFGLDSTQVGTQIRHAFYGAEALRQQRGRDEVRVMVRLPENERNSRQDIDALILRTPEGGEIPLTEAARIESSRSYTQIKRTNGRRVLNVTADVDRTVASANKILGRLAKKALPALAARYPGLTYRFAGERKDLAESLRSLFAGFALAMLVIYAMLAIPLRSYTQPLIIMTAIPFGIVGAVVGHLIMGFQLSLISMMGIVALAGVVVNDSLVLVCATNDRRRQGASAFDAVSSAGVRRFRPILLTSLTTFFGLTPMILETSMQARFLIPMAISLGYGVLMATFITLLLVPSLYLIVNDLRGLLVSPNANATAEGGSPALPRRKEQPAGDGPASVSFEAEGPGN